MKTLLLSAVAALALTAALPGGAVAQSIGVALDATPDRDKQATYRYADNLMTGLAELGWDTEAFPQGSLGGEDERLDQIRSGILDLSMSNYAVANQFVPELRVMQLPYTFATSRQVYNFFSQSDYLDEVNAKLEAEGMRILAIVPSGGQLGIFNNKHEVKTAADMAGLRMRALDPNQLKMFEMLGASGVVIPFSEVPNAIQTGIADGYVNASVVPLAFGQADLFTNFTDARVIMSARLALASTAWWDGLSEEEQAQVEEVSDKALEEVFAFIDTAEVQHRADLETAGIAVYEPSEEELATFKDATRDMGTLLEDVSQERIAELREMVSGYSAE